MPPKGDHPRRSHEWRHREWWWASHRFPFFTSLFSCVKKCASYLPVADGLFVDSTRSTKHAKTIQKGRLQSLQLKTTCFYDCYFRKKSVVARKGCRAKCPILFFHEIHHSRCRHSCERRAGGPCGGAPIASNQHFKAGTPYQCHINAISTTHRTGSEPRQITQTTQILNYKKEGEGRNGFQVGVHYSGWSR